MLCRYIQLKTRSRPSRINLRNVKTWLSNRNEPIASQEVGFIHAPDLITVARLEKSMLRKLFEQLILAPTSGIFGIHSNKTSTASAHPVTTTIIGEDEHVDTVAAIALFVVALAMLIAPLWILAVLEDTFRKLAVITGFTLVLLLVLAWGTLDRKSVV